MSIHQRGKTDKLQHYKLTVYWMRLLSREGMSPPDAEASVGPMHGTCFVKQMIELLSVN